MSAVYQKLLHAFGPQHWWPADSRLEMALGAVLTQNASWRNVERTLALLKSRRMLSLTALASLSSSQLARLIRPAGLYRVKARRARALLRLLVRRGGFSRLARISTPDLRSDLLGCHGIGPETADSILLYAFVRPVFVIDAYTRRIISRLGLARGDEPYEELRRMFESGLPRRARLFGEYHALLVRLAKTECRPVPRCGYCPLRGICAFAHSRRLTLPD